MKRGTVLQKTLRSFRYAASGFKPVWKGQRNIKIQLGCGLLALCAGILFRISGGEFVIILVLCAFVLVFEIFNTAIEKTIDLIGRSYSRKLGEIKDICAAGVLIAAIAAVIGGCIIFIPYIRRSFFG